MNCRCDEIYFEYRVHVHVQATHNNEVTTWLNHIEEATTAYKRKDHR